MAGCVSCAQPLDVLDDPPHPLDVTLVAADHDRVQSIQELDLDRSQQAAARGTFFAAFRRSLAGRLPPRPPPGRVRLRPARELPLPPAPGRAPPGAPFGLALENHRRHPGDPARSFPAGSTVAVCASRPPLCSRSTARRIFCGSARRTGINSAFCSVAPRG